MPSFRPALETRDCLKDSDLSSLLFIINFNISLVNSEKFIEKNKHFSQITCDIWIIYSKKSIYRALNKLNEILVNIFNKLFSSKKFRSKRLRDSNYDCYQTKNEKN